MPEAKSPSRIIQETLASILTTAEASLRIDSRTVTVVKHLPGQSYAQRFPLVAVEKPIRIERQDFGCRYERLVYRVPMTILEVCGVRPDDGHEAEERLALLFTKLRGVISSSSHLEMAFLHVHESFNSWDEEEIDAVGNNLRRLPLSYEIPVVIENGKVWEV